MFLSRSNQFCGLSEWFRIVLAVVKNYTCSSSKYASPGMQPQMSWPNFPSSIPPCLLSMLLPSQPRHNSFALLFAPLNPSKFRSSVSATSFLNAAPSGPTALPFRFFTSSVISSTISSNSCPGSCGTPSVAPCNASWLSAR